MMRGPIHWYPGHMARARRELTRLLRWVDAVIELADARSPAATRNPDLLELIARRPHALLLGKSDLADPESTQGWIGHFREAGTPAWEVDLARGAGLGRAFRALGDFLGRERTGPTVRAAVVGLPNVGKSTLINRIAGRKRAGVGARPGVTRAVQWLNAGEGLQLLDTPGLLWPRLDDPEQALRLAWLDCIGEAGFDPYPVSLALWEWLSAHRPEQLADRYGFGAGSGPATADEGLAWIGRRRGALRRGGEVDIEQAALLLLRDFRAGAFGRLTLEAPPGDAGR